MSEDPFGAIGQAMDLMVDQIEDARALALRLKDILRQFPSTLESLDPDLAWENLPDWFTGDDQGVKLWRQSDD